MMAKSAPLATYQHGHHASVVASHARRSAEVDAAFFLPYLKPGMRLIDIGCGPGSITLGLAHKVAPAAAFGVDASADVIATARTLHATANVPNLTFEAGNLFALRFEAASFDAVFVHQVLQHLPQPVRALEHLKTLLAPGGVLGVRDVDWGSTTFFPESAGMRRFLELYYALAKHNGGQPNAGRFLRHWAHAAGLEVVATTTSTQSYAGGAPAREWGETWVGRTLSSNIAQKSLQLGLASRSDLQSIAASWRAWGDDPDALFAFAHTEIVARAR
jgi:ubiquinone/menaquinone biosynthesis C-methylase UbiE